MEKKMFEQGIKTALENSKKRKFTQSMDLVLNFRAIDFSKPEKRINVDVHLPKSRGKEPKVCLFAGDAMAKTAQGKVDRIIKKDQVSELAKDKKALKDIAEEFDFFFSEPQLMAEIGKTWGVVLGPRKKMPKPLLPNQNIEVIVKRAKSMITVSNAKGKFMPVVHVSIGSESMPVNEIADNAFAVYEAVKSKLEKGDVNIKSIYVKTTMGSPVKVGV